MKDINISLKIIKRWTQTAIDCYSIGCCCDKCKLKDIINEKCKMKNTVINLVKKFGAPKDININYIIED